MKTEHILITAIAVVGVVTLGVVAVAYLLRPKEPDALQKQRMSDRQDSNTTFLCPTLITQSCPNIILESITEDIKETEGYPCTHPVTHKETTCYEKNERDYSIVNHDGKEEKIILD